ncbi:MAG: hypothetical protein V7736_10955 [Colwellia polaris]|jgi:hypothetical protein|uniref:hypothetical protein n=1 Tax=Colwellia polaris TaxID=326537 RepID=UPI000A172E96|nr:hypothetical protein [Colwellia polaris]|tara:strand:- start:11561 stop:11962 length:402 start_codon:yes stop_codon:yes gene_type:complete
MTLRSILLVLAITITTGCTTLADSVKGKGTGVSKTYNYSKEDIWPLAVNAVNVSELELISSSKETGIILAQRGITAFSYGENVAVFVDSESDNTCKVEVVSKRAMQTNVFAPDWSAKILNEITYKLDEVAKVD